MLVECPNCASIISARSFREGQACLGCLEPLRMKQCTVVMDPVPVGMDYGKGKLLKLATGLR